MEITNTIASLIGHGHGRATTGSALEHKWNQLLGIELELEDVTEENGGYVGDGNGDPYSWEDDDDWADIDDDEREERLAAWNNNQNSNGLLPQGWTTHNDQSLRNGIEFVTHPALAGADLQNAIDAFYSRKYRYVASPRTSTHIHVNMTDALPAHLQSLTMLVYTFEDAIYRLVDLGRKYSGYSTALIDMPPSRLRNVLNPPSVDIFMRAINVSQNRDRYYGFNFNIARHGTVEFRYFPGAPTKEQLESWVDLVVALKTAAVKYSPDDLDRMINDPLSLQSFMRVNLGAWAAKMESVSSVESLFSFFEEINTLRTDEFNPERTNSVAFMTPAYDAFVKAIVLRGSREAVDYLSSTVPVDRPVTSEDFGYYLAQARRMIKLSNTELTDAPYPPPPPLLPSPEWGEETVQDFMSRVNTIQFNPPQVSSANRVTSATAYTRSANAAPTWARSLSGSFNSWSVPEEPDNPAIVFEDGDTF